MRATSEHTLERRLDAGGWGLLFIWVGVALAANVGWGAGLVGVGVVTLAVQALRRGLGVAVDRFAVAIGVGFVAGGIWTAFDVGIALVPLLCIAAGAALLASALGLGRATSRRRMGPGTPAARPPA